MVNKQVFQKKQVGANGLLIDYSDKRVVTILNALLEHIGYKIENTIRKKRVNGKLERVYTYNIVSKSPNDILKMMNKKFDDTEQNEKLEQTDEIEEVEEIEEIEEKPIKFENTSLTEWLACKEQPKYTIRVGTLT